MMTTVDDINVWKSFCFVRQSSVGFHFSCFVFSFENLCGLGPRSENDLGARPRKSIWINLDGFHLFLYFIYWFGTFENFGLKIDGLLVKLRSNKNVTGNAMFVPLPVNEFMNSKQSSIENQSVHNGIVARWNRSNDEMKWFYEREKKNVWKRKKLKCVKKNTY